MKIRSLKLRNFRLFDNYELSFEDKNIIVGPNGSGKTTIIEAVNYASVFSPLRTYETDKDLVKLGENYFNIGVEFETEDSKISNIFIGYEIKEDKGKKKIKLDGKTTNTIKVSGKLKVIPFLIEDYEIVVGSPSWRRKMIDNFLISSNESYYPLLINYYKTLKQKNASIKLIEKLKTESPPNLTEMIEQIKELIRTYNSNLSKFAVEITKHRLELHEYLTSRIKSMLDLDIEIKYKSQLAEIVKSSQDPITEFTNLLNRELDREVSYGKSIIGPHLDDMVMVFKTKLAKTFLSQGQIRLASIFFKIACAEYISEKTKTKPILLMDDVLGELDETNRKKVIEKIFSLPYQIIISFFEIPEGIDRTGFKIIELKQN